MLNRNWNRNVILSLGLMSMAALANAATHKENWETLLDEKLSQWTTYLGTPRPETAVTDLPKNAQGNYTQPIGYGKDELKVFNVEMQQGEPVVHVSGEIYGGLFTRNEFENYRLVLEFKWGDKKYPPRLNEPLDTGVLYHVVGEQGVDYWKAWALSQEFQIMEHHTGDWWQIAGSTADIRCEKKLENPVTDLNVPQFDPAAPSIAFGAGGLGNTCLRAKDNEKPKGEWNRLELISVGDKSLHIVNGQVVMALTNSRYSKDGKEIPLVKGKILLQSEAGEAFFRRIKLQPINEIPTEYKKYFK